MFQKVFTRLMKLVMKLIMKLIMNYMIEGNGDSQFKSFGSTFHKMLVQKQIKTKSNCGPHFKCRCWAKTYNTVGHAVEHY